MDTNQILSDEALRELMPVVGDKKCLNWARWGATKQFEEDSRTASQKDAEIAELNKEILRLRQYIWKVP